MATTNKNSNVCDVKEEINRVRKNHRILEKQIEKITDRLCLERDQASDERYQARVKNDSMKEELANSREQLQKAKEELQKLKDLTDEEIDSLTAERDDSNEDKFTYQQEYEGNKEKLKSVKEELSKIQEAYRQLAEHRDEITDQLVIERDNASDERYRARIRCDEVKTKILEIEGQVAETRAQYNKLKDETDAVNNTLITDCDRYKDDVRNYNNEYEANTKLLDDLRKEMCGNEQPTYAKVTTRNLSNFSTLQNSNDSGIEIDLDAMTRDIKNQVDNIVDMKLSKLGIKQSKGVSTMRRNDIGENIAGGHSRENETRELNIIIHGLDENNEGDEVSIKKLFTIMEMDTGPTIAYRLGAKREDRGRPIKIVMKTKSNKAEFMSKLWKLKYADCFDGKIRVTDDFTWEERCEIRRWVTMAEERNRTGNEETTTKYKWKVRGTPRCGIRIVQIRV